MKVALLGFVVLGSIACASGPSAPQPPVPTLAMSQSAVALERTGTSSLRASSTLGGLATDVTTAAVWRSSNTAVATVLGGVVTAVGPGSVRIDAEHGGQSASSAVTVRRRVFLKGILRFTDAFNRGTLKSQTSYINGIWASNSGTSSADPWIRSSLGTASNRIPLAPGEHTVVSELRNDSSDFRISAEEPMVRRPPTLSSSPI